MGRRGRERKMRGKKKTKEKNWRIMRKTGRRGKRINEGRKRRNYGGWKEGREKKERKRRYVRNKGKRAKKYSNPLSTPLQEQCM